MNASFLLLTLLLLCVPTLALVVSDQFTLPNQLEVTIYRQTEWIYCREYAVVVEVKALVDLYVDKAEVVFKFIDEQTLSISKSKSVVEIRRSLAKFERVQFSLSTTYCPREPRDPLILMGLTVYTNLTNPSLYYFIGRVLPMTFNDAMREIEKLRSEVEKLREEVEKLEEELKRKECEVAAREEELKGLRSRLEEVETEYRELVKKLEEVRESYHRLEGAYTRVLEERDSLKSSYSELADRYWSLRENHTAVLTELNMLRLKYAELTEEVNRLRALKDNLTHRLAVLIGERESLRNVFEELKKDYESLHYRYELAIGDLRTATTLAIVAFLGFAGSALAYLWPRVRRFIKRRGGGDVKRLLPTWPPTRE